LEEDRRRESMEKLRRDMEKSKGETVVLSTGLKGEAVANKSMLEDKEEEEYDEDVEDDDYERFSEEEEEDMIDDEDEEVARFSF